MATKHLISGRWHWGPSFAGYKVYVYEPGTSTPKATYSDSALTVANTDPVVLDANGAASIWFAGNAKVIVKTPLGSTYATDDNVNRSENSTATGNYNLILNGSFEDDAVGDGVPDSWDLTLYTDGAFAIDTATQFHGQKSAKFTSVGTGGGYLTSTSQFAIRAGKVYNVFFGIKSSVADVRNVVQVLWYKADGTASATASSTAYDESAANPTSWTAQTAAVTAPADAYFAKIRLIGCHNSDTTSGITWFDDVTITDAVTIAETQTVTADKTFSGDINFSAGATIGTAVIDSTGVMTAGTVPPARRSFKGAYVYINGTQSVSSGALTNLNFDTEYYDTDSFHDTVTNNARITIPAGVSYVRLVAGASFNTASGYQAIYIKKNTTDTVVYAEQPAVSGGSLNLVSPVISVVEGDYFTVAVAQDSGGSATVDGYFSIEVVN